MLRYRQTFEECATYPQWFHTHLWIYLVFFQAGHLFCPGEVGLHPCASWLQILWFCVLSFCRGNTFLGCWVDVCCRLVWFFCSLWVCCSITEDIWLNRCSWWFGIYRWYWNLRCMKSLISSTEAFIFPAVLSCCCNRNGKLPKRNAELYSVSFVSIDSLPVFLNFFRSSLNVSAYGSYLSWTHLHWKTSLKPSRRCSFLKSISTFWIFVSGSRCNVCQNSVVSFLIKLSRKRSFFCESLF